MAAGPVVCMVWEGSHAVKTGRVLLGETNPTDSISGLRDQGVKVQGVKMTPCTPLTEPLA